MKNPLISVLMPAYNAEIYLKSAIESILSQSYSNFEFIIINDGSTDNTENIILSYTDPRIVYIKNEVNLKLIKSLNKGIDAVKGEYVLRMDADDIAMPDLIKETLNIIQEQNAGVVSNYKFHYLSDNGNKLYYNARNVPLSNKAISYILPFSNPIPHPGTLIKTSILKKYRYRDDGQVLHFEDWDLWNRISNGGEKYALVSKCVYLWRQNPTSVLHSTVGDNEKLKRIKNEIKQNLLYKNGVTMPEELLALFLFDNQKFTIHNFFLLKKEMKKYFQSFNIDDKVKCEIKNWLSLQLFLIIKRIIKSNVKAPIKFQAFITLLLFSPSILTSSFCRRYITKHRKDISYLLP